MSFNKAQSWADVTWPSYLVYQSRLARDAKCSTIVNKRSVEWEILCCKPHAAEQVAEEHVDLVKDMALHEKIVVPAFPISYFLTPPALWPDATTKNTLNLHAVEMSSSTWRIMLLRLTPVCDCEDLPGLYLPQGDTQQTCECVNACDCM